MENPKLNSLLVDLAMSGHPEGQCEYLSKCALKYESVKSQENREELLNAIYKCFYGRFPAGSRKAIAVIWGVASGVLGSIVGSGAVVIAALIIAFIGGKFGSPLLKFKLADGNVCAIGGFHNALFYIIEYFDLYEECHKYENKHKYTIYALWGGTAIIISLIAAVG